MENEYIIVEKSIHGNLVTVKVYPKQSSPDPKINVYPTGGSGAHKRGKS
jgi:hypothetical protein